VIIENSAVAEHGIPEPFEFASLLLEKLRFHTDSWDLSVDLKAGVREVVPIDARSVEAYRDQHIPGAISFPHRTMNAESARDLDRERLYIVYCDGIGCNASTKGALKLSVLGFRAKELLGGLDWWNRDGHPVCTGDAPGDLKD
jgi:rhodanese-related sulfurtransferase